ncbi:MAG: sodium:proton antiporter [Pirellulaceae bacterium]|nr:sodium:proton antiporter [Pirellulaceae bacterium]
MGFLDLNEEQLFFCYLAGVPLLGVIAQWLAWRLRLPSILLLLLFGILLGQLFTNPDLLLAKLIEDPDNETIGPKLLFPFVSLSVAVILFEGGLSLRLSELRTAGRGVFRLVTLGALISWFVTTLFAVLLLDDLDLRLAALLGAVLVVTGPTVVAPLLRHIRPVQRVASIVKWEGIVIDPIGAVLAVLVFEEIITHGNESSLLGMVSLLVKTALLGGAIGLVTANLLMQMVKRFWLPDYLHGVVFLAIALGSFAVSNILLDESGLVTVTVLGVILANQKTIPIHHVIQFKEHLGVFLISCLFIVLGSRLDPRVFLDLGWRGMAFLASLILIVRPLAIFVSTVGSGLAFREKIFFAWLAPRGIVAAAVMSVFALKIASMAHGLPVEHEVPGMAILAEQAEQLVPITFLVIVGTVAVYGLTAGPLAKWLNLSDTNPQGILFVGAEPWVREMAQLLDEENLQTMLVDTNYANVAAARMSGMRAECISVLSEHVNEDIDLAGIGKLLAMTANDEVNALAVNEFAHVFGRVNVYQLPPWDSTSGRRASVGDHLRGRLLFDKQLNHDELEGRMENGFQLKKTRLSEEFTLDDFVARYGESATILFVMDEVGRLTIPTVAVPLKPQPGQTIIGLIDAAADEQSTQTAADQPGS